MLAIANSAARQVPAGANVALAGLLCGLQLWTLFVLPLFVLPLSPWWGLAVLPSILVTPTFWALIHEGIHRHLHPDPRLNDRWSRVLAVLFGGPFRLMRVGHLGHHQLNGIASERPDLVAVRHSSLIARLLFYPRLIFGIYAGEVGGCLLGFLPRRTAERIVRGAFYDGASDAPGASDAAVRALTGARARAELRLDGGVTIAGFLIAFWAYGEDWEWLVLAVVGRGVVVSVLDNAFHYGGPIGDPHGGHNLRLPGWAAPMLLHFNLHRIHHRHPNLPWVALPDALAADGDRVDLGFAHAVFRQFRGPLPPEAVQTVAPARR